MDETALPADDIDPLDMVFTDYLRRCDSGEPLSREAFLADLPDDLAVRLKDLIEAADRIADVTATNRDTDFSFSRHGADTIAGQIGDDSSGNDMAATLPMAHRADGDHGPTLPYDLGDYELIEILGRGGMGVVYRAHQKELHRDVAVKMIRSGILASEAQVRRFYIEAQAAARLQHPGIVSVYQFGRRADHHFFSMEYIVGSDLQKRINTGQIDCRDAARYVRDVARAIQHAHDAGVLHRDLKPANILIDKDDQVHVTDFGLAKHIDGDSSVTASGDALGTPHYMAPEQAGGYSDRACRQSDVYSLGAVLFATLAGRPPIVGDTVMQTLAHVVHDPAPPVRSIRSDVPIDLETICAKCLEKQPARRYETAGELATELDAFLEGRPIQARPRWAAVKAAQWFTGIPLFGALTGRKVLTSTASHRRFQAAMLCLFLLAPLVVASIMLHARQVRDAMPTQVVVAGGIEGGMYNVLSQRLADNLSTASPVQTSVLHTGGSLDNHRLLLSGEVDLAPMQATAVVGDDVRVAAPLFYELLYVMARNDRGIDDMNDLAGRTIAVGPTTSGTATAANLVFASLALPGPPVRLVNSDWSSIGDVDATMMFSGRGSQLVDQWLASGNWHLLSLPDAVEIALEHPSLQPMRIRVTDHPQIGLPKEGIATVGTTAFLAVRAEAPAELVSATLRALYHPPMPHQLIPKSQAAEWRGLAFHPAARAFYQGEPLGRD